MKVVSAEEAIRAIPDGSRVIFPHTCVEPVALYEAFSREVERFRRLTVHSGLSFGRYAFLERGLGEHFRYVTWQASARLRDLVRAGRIGFLPARYGELTRLYRRSGPLPPDVVVTQVSPPAADGTVSLGISTSLHRHLVEEASLVIAEVHPDMPVTGGDSRVSAERIDLAVEATAPLLEYETAPARERDAAIVDRVLERVPDGAFVQLGVGAVPDRVLARLAELRDIRLFTGIVTGGLEEFLGRARHAPRVVTGEIAGPRSLYELCGRRPEIEMAPVTVTHDVCRLAALPRFVSVNSAIEVDLMGQVNGETIGDLQVSGVGGSLDFMEAAVRSEGGLSILAFPSTTEDGQRSKIVRCLAPGAVVTTPRHCVDWVVTEYGAAALRGRTLEERAEALIAIAHPDFRDELGRGAAPGPRPD